MIQFDGFDLDVPEQGTDRSLAVPVDQTVNLLISDPFTEELLFSARWHVDTLAVRGPQASVNAWLDANLSDIRVNNTVASPTLDRFAGETSGVLVMHLLHTEDIAPALRAGEPIYATVSGTVHPESCVR